MEKIELRIMDGPTIHGSTRIVNEPGNRPGDESGDSGGLKVRRKLVSPFNDLMVKDMATHVHNTLPCKIEAGERHEGNDSRLRGVHNVSRHRAGRLTGLVERHNGHSEGGRQVLADAACCDEGARQE
tara:strand:- start:16616 stop:16996 length:381 start_codon:yes stop_codon:yes gene_type:complete